MVAVTPEVDRYGKMFGALGDRFLRVRWTRAGGVGAMKAAAKQDRLTTESLKTATHLLMAPYIDRGGACEVPTIPDEMLDCIGNLSEFVCIARTYVHRDNKEIDSEPSPESNTRLPQQLCQVARGWTALMGERVVGEEGFALVNRVAMDCLPPMRRHVLDNLSAARPIYDGSVSANGVDRAVEELVWLNIIKPPDDPDKRELTDMAQGLLSMSRRQKGKVTS